MESSIKINDIKIKEWENGIIKFEVTDENNNPVDGAGVVKLNDNTFLKGKVVNGIFSQRCSFQELHNEEYKLEAIYGGNANCKTSNAYATLYIEKVDPIVFSFKDLQNASYRLARWISINKRLPGKIAIDKKQIFIGNLLYIFAQTIVNLDNNKTDDIKLVGFATPKVSTESIKDTVVFTKEEVVDICKEIIETTKTTNSSPSAIETSKGKIGFTNLLYTLAVMVSNSSSTGLLSSIYVRPWKKIVAK